MKIAILSRDRRIYSTGRLLETARARGHRVRVLAPAQFLVSLEEEYPDLYYRGRPLEAFDAVIPRIAAAASSFGTAVVRQFEQMGVFCANSSLGILNVRDKLRALQILSRHDVGIPATEFVSRREDVMPAIQRLGGAPVIIKLLEGTQGVGVILAETEPVAEAIVETLHSARQDVLLQKFVAESKGRDIRAFVVGDRVVAAMRRTAHGLEFRSNIHRGGKAEPVTLDEHYEQTAIRATQILGLRVGGVDMLESQAGPQITEVNSSPGLEGIEAATGIDVAAAIVEFIEELVKFPELDVRQRLTVTRGYGVAEFPLPRGLVGETVASSGLREEDIAVLSIFRAGRVIPNPKSARVLEAGDRLLCFGRLASMKALVPERKRRVRRLGKKKSGAAVG